MKKKKKMEKEVTKKNGIDTELNLARLIEIYGGTGLQKLS